ncbi:Na+/H+ antiporter NhaA, partial [Nostoc sp. NIES-2111]
MSSGRDNIQPTSEGRIQAFLRGDTAPGLILAATAVLAIVLFNYSPVNPYYRDALQAPLSVGFADAELSKPLLLWINDGLMALFFLLVGLELKREILEGSLSSRDQIVLPALAAVGGMAIPALIYLLINGGDPVLQRGWAIPAATDIAFALGALSLLGRRVPISLKVFLLTLATLDDLGAIVVIAIFYTAQISITALTLAGFSVAVLLVLNRLHYSRTGLYAIVGGALWLCVL